MPLITTIEPENAQGTVAEIYHEIDGMLGLVPNAIKLDSINPEHMANHWNAIKLTLQHPSLSEKFFTLIRLLISEIHHCEYCIGFNAGMLIQMHGLSQEQLAEIGRAPAQAPLDEKERALLLFVVKTVQDSNGATAAEVEELKAKDCSEREIFDGLAHGAQQVAGDIMLNAFKVEADISAIGE